MFLGLSGANSTSKTGIAYTAPPPIVGLQFDQGFRRAIYGERRSLYADLDIVEVPWPPKDPQGSEVNGMEYWLGQIARSENACTVFYLPQPIQLDTVRLAGFKKLRAAATALVGGALKNDKVKSIVMDTATLGRDIMADAYLEELQGMTKPGDKMRVQLIQIEYKFPNDRMRDIYSSVQILSDMTGKNFIATHHLTDVYEDVAWDAENNRMITKRTGEQRLDGLRESEDFFDVHIRMERKRDTTKMTPSYYMEGTWMKGGPALSLVGQKIVSPTWNTIVDTLNKHLDPRAQYPKRPF